LVHIEELLMPISPSLTDRGRGVLVGLACGDALGAPVEFESREVIAAKYPDGLRDFTSGGWMDVVPGELTDDSRMMLDLAETLVRPGPVDLDHLGQRFVAWMEEGPKDIGNTTRLAIQSLQSGRPWSEAGQFALDQMGSHSAASNGSVMRCAPVAIRFRDDPGRLKKLSIDTARITHAEPRCTWAAVALNQAIAHALNGGSPDGLADAATAGIEQPDVVQAILTAPGRTAAGLDGSGYVLNAVQIAIWATLTQLSLEEAVVSAVMIGKDTDTNAAVTGALAGAVHGYAAIPERWRTAIHQHDRLISLADQLLAGADPGD
jgi:ADP-ribosyl-[dinitrogen reductase] hydrolase